MERGEKKRGRGVKSNAYVGSERPQEGWIKEREERWWSGQERGERRKGN